MMNKYQRRIIGKKYGYKPKMNDIAWFLRHLEILTKSSVSDPFMWVTADSIWEISFEHETIKLTHKNITDNKGFTESVPAVAEAAGWTVLIGPVEFVAFDGRSVPDSTHNTHDMILMSRKE